MTLPELSFSEEDEARLAALGQRLKHRFDADSGPAALARLFSGEVLRPAEFARLAGDAADDLLAFSLVTPCGGGARARVLAQMVQGSLVVTDLWRPELECEPFFLDPLWEAPLIAPLIVQGRARRALDLGCGSGVLALALARDCDEVIGLDVNPRAVAFARFNALLNGVRNVTFLQSDLFAAAGSEPFDRIVFNAPVGFEFRPKNLLAAGEEILERFFREMPSRLAPGGVVQVNMSVKDWKGDPFFARLDRWLGADARHLHYVFLQRSHVQSGHAFFLRRLFASLAHGVNAFRCVGLRRGWLTLRRAPQGRSIVVDTDYYQWTDRGQTGSLGAALLSMISDPGPPEHQIAAINRAAGLDSPASPSPVARTLPPAASLGGLPALHEWSWAELFAAWTPSLAMVGI